MASVKYSNGTSKPTKSSIWNIEKIGSSTVFKIESASQKTKISYAGKEWEINKYYLSLPKSLSIREINHILASVPAQDLIVNASISANYTTRIEALRKECANLTLVSYREEVWRNEYDKIMKDFTFDQIESIVNINSLILPFTWQLTPIYDSIELNGANLAVNKGERVFVLQVL